VMTYVTIAWTLLDLSVKFRFDLVRR